MTVLRGELGAETFMRLLQLAHTSGVPLLSISELWHAASGAADDEDAAFDLLDRSLQMGMHPSDLERLSCDPHGPATAHDTRPGESRVAKTCDNACVGVVIIERHADGPRYLLFQRMTAPIGIAPCAGHVDDHGSATNAAIAEVDEELGLSVERLDEVWRGWLPNRCRRASGPRGIGHAWTIYTATATGRLSPSRREAAAPRLASGTDIAELAARTLAYGREEIGHASFAARPGLEPVWIVWFSRMGILEVSSEDLELARKLFR